MLYAASATSPLSSIALCDERLYQATDLTFFVKSHFPMFPGVNNACNVRNSNASFCDVGRF